MNNKTETGLCSHEAHVLTGGFDSNHIKQENVR